MEAIEAYIDATLDDFHPANVRQLYSEFKHRDPAPFLVAFEFEFAHLLGAYIKK